MFTKTSKMCSICKRCMTKKSLRENDLIGSL